MSSHQAVSVQRRQATRSELAKLKKVAPKSLSYLRSNAKLQEYKAEISQIQEAITNEEAARLRNIDPDPHYEVIFEHHDQVHIGREITDSNFTADIAIGTPGEYDYMELLSANSTTIQSILQDERGKLGSIKIRMGIYATMWRIINYQEGLFKNRNFSEEEDEYDYRYHIIFKTHNMPILSATNINDTFNFELMRIAEWVDDYQNYGSGWKFYRVEKIFIEVTQFQPSTGLVI
jgi:hypothetical protein